MSIVNSTIASNIALTGGGITDIAAGPLSLAYTTVASNQATGPPGSGASLHLPPLQTR